MAALQLEVDHLKTQLAKNDLEHQKETSRLKGTIQSLKDRLRENGISRSQQESQLAQNKKNMRDDDRGFIHLEKSLKQLEDENVRLREAMARSDESDGATANEFQIIVEQNEYERAAEIRKWTESLRALERALATSKSMCAELETEVDLLRGTHMAHVCLVSAMSQQERWSFDMAEMLESRVITLREEIARIRTECDARLARMQTERDEAIQATKEAERKLSEMSDRNVSLEEKNQQLAVIVEKLNHQKDEAEKCTRLVKGQLDQLLDTDCKKSELLSLRVQKHKLTTTIQKLRTEVWVLERKVEKTTKACSELEAKLQKAKLDRSKIGKENKEMQRVIEREGDLFLDMKDKYLFALQEVNVLGSN
ncbi:hypothetical protein HK102_002031 [Quaeritorhiza haematococci]|nr:hypothetical protein HK102_002031 [Quaeritorhiza haematococci]